ncbi:MAG: pyridoxamine 5'-phosphate oxidase family protein [Mariprofundaceae bacterium]
MSLAINELSKLNWAGGMKMSESSGQTNALDLDVKSDSWQQAIVQLLDQCQVSFLSTLGDHGPETSMAPFAIYQGHVLLHLSSLAKHTINIERDANIGLMICKPETKTSSPLALPRLSLQGNISIVADDQLVDSKAAYLESIPDAESLFSFADFRLFQLTPRQIHWIGGFGKARKVSLQQWKAM